MPRAEGVQAGLRAARPAWPLLDPYSADRPAVVRLRPSGSGAVTEAVGRGTETTRERSAEAQEEADGAPSATVSLV
ncbi:hypothetical protein ACFSEO_10465 [Agromyces cerinus subsp. nitratus]|uniref:hypothetical protein n=1 Tax=Agromyces cerinus TaxID=33878 RepID=UPI003630349E